MDTKIENPIEQACKNINLHGESVLSYRQISITGYQLSQFIVPATRSIIEKYIAEQMAKCPNIVAKLSKQADAYFDGTVKVGDTLELSNYATPAYIINKDDVFDIENVAANYIEDAKLDKNFKASSNAMQFVIRLYSINTASTVVATTRFENKESKVVESKPSIIIQ